MAELLNFPMTAFLPFPEEEPQTSDTQPTEIASPAIPLLETAAPSTKPARTKQPSDAPARESALDVHRSWIVEAPAGSGKTGLLIQRFLKLLASEEVQRPSEVMAITFTRKAAAELRTRVLEQLAAAAANTPLPADAGFYEHTTRALAVQVLARNREHAWHLLDSPHSLNIRTIDSFCAELAASLPVSSRYGGRQTPMDDPQPLYEEAAERVVRQLGGPDPALDAALRCILLHRDAQIPDCLQLIAFMLAGREQWAQFLPLDHSHWNDELLDGDIRSQLERTLQREISRVLAAAQQALSPGLLSDLAHFAEGISTHSRSAGLRVGLPQAPGVDPSDLQHWLPLLDLLFTAQNEWRSSVKPNHLKLSLDAARQQQLKLLIKRCQQEETHTPDLKQRLAAVRCLPPATYPEEQWRVVKSLFRVLRYALVELRSVFAERGACDFTEVALTARGILADESLTHDLVHTPCLQLSHLLVDEMQDTSAGQYQLLEQLTRHWDGYAQTLFLVGDPKQSIYLFRQARVERFLRTQQSGLLGDIPLTPLRLTANFRSQAFLVEAFNDAFKLILPTSNTERSDEHAPITHSPNVPFVAATATRPGGAQAALHWHFDPTRAPTREQHNPAEDAETEQATIDPETEPLHARHIRQSIELFQQRWQEQKPRLREPRIAVLARSRSHLVPIVAEFQNDYGYGRLPFHGVDIELLDQRPEVLDLLALARALLHPADRVAWLAILRSPVCGLSVADLLALTGEDPGAGGHVTVASLVQTRAHHLSTDGRGLLDRTWPVLAEALRTLGQTAFSTHIERTWRSLGADAFLSTEQLANARRFLRLLGELDSTGEPIDLATLQRRLGKLYASSSCPSAQVELMTIHRAKGLEWDLVLIPALDRSTGQNTPELLQWFELEGDAPDTADVILAPIQSKGTDASILSRWLARLKSERELAEARRLFYVACTRAREELHLFASYSHRSNGELTQPRPGSLLHASWAAASPVLENQLHAQVEHQSAHAAPQPAAPAHASGSRLLVMPSLQWADTSIPGPLTLAAAASPQSPLPTQRNVPLIARLPPDLHPLQRFTPGQGPFPLPSAAIPTRPATLFQRPVGSFAARAFGNVVHRFLELLADRLHHGLAAETLLQQLPGWRTRLHTSLRSEGLPPALCARDADRALLALQNALHDHAGRWLLSPHPGGVSELAIEVEADILGSRQLRADRVFLAGPDPLSPACSHLWIVDFKTTEQGGRSPELFLASERRKYEPQLRSYARAALGLYSTPQPVVLALFYPLIPQMLHWLFDPLPASE